MFSVKTYRYLRMLLELGLFVALTLAALSLLAMVQARDASAREEFYVVSESESAQIFYDAQRKVMAVSVNYLGDLSKAPAPEKVFGAPVEAKPDGSVYKMVRYQRAGYFVVYARTADDSPLVNVTMQKILD
jgi:hypothetical protein